MPLVALALLLGGLVLGLLPPDTLAAVPTPAPPPGRAAGATAPSGSAGGQIAPGGARSSISGVVLLDEDVSGGPSSGDRPVIGVSVRLDGPGVSSASSTGAAGSFSFDGLRGGTYVLTIGLPGGVVSLSGTSRTVTVDGRGSARADFFVARPDKAVGVPTDTPPPSTPTPAPTATPRPLPTPVPAPGYTYQGGSTAAPSSPSGPAARSSTYVPRPIVSSLPIRYAPGRDSPTSIEPMRTTQAFWLGVPFISQLDGTLYAGVNCGPASTAMVLSAYGIRAAPSLLRDYVNFISGSYGTGQGTSLDALSRVLREAGLETYYLYGDSGGYLRWSTDLLRDQIAAGRPVITLVKYRALPGHSASISDWDHYIVISGLAGNDFIYNDAAYGSAAGYGLLISPADIQRAWDYSSIPRHGVAADYAGRSRLVPDPLDLGAAVEDQLADVEAGLGEEVPSESGYDALLFRRVALDELAGDEVDGAPALELGDRVDWRQPAAASLPVAQAPLETLDGPPLQPVRTATRQPLADLMGPLTLVTVLVLLIGIGLVARRTLG